MAGHSLSVSDQLKQASLGTFSDWEHTNNIIQWSAKTFPCLFFFFLKSRKPYVVDDIIAHDFRKPQDGQHLSCQKNAHNILLQKPPCPQSCVFRPCESVMERKQCACRGHRKQALQTIRIWRCLEAAGVRAFSAPFPSSVLASWAELKSQKAVSYHQHDSKTQNLFPPQHCSFLSLL